MLAGQAAALTLHNGQVSTQDLDRRTARQGQVILPGHLPLQGPVGPAHQPGGRGGGERRAGRQESTCKTLMLDEEDELLYGSADAGGVGVVQDQSQ